MYLRHIIKNYTFIIKDEKWLAPSPSNMMIVSLNPGLANSFLIPPPQKKMIALVLCNIFEQIWYSEFILASFQK